MLPTRSSPIVKAVFSKPVWVYLGLRQTEPRQRRA
jgi:hypothetical protein